MNDLNVETFILSNDKIKVIPQEINPDGESNKDETRQALCSSRLCIVKCFKLLGEITTFEAKSTNIINMHKSFFINLPNLVSIDLRHNQIVKLDQSFTLLKNLTTIKLDYNNLTIIPNMITSLTKLEYFSVGNNKISYIPSCIQQMSTLKTLILSNNLIEAVPIEIGMLKSLEVLHLCGNYLTQIPTTLTFVKTLSELSIEWFEFLDPPQHKTQKLTEQGSPSSKKLDLEEDGQYRNLDEDKYTNVMKALKDYLKKLSQDFQVYLSFEDFMENFQIVANQHKVIHNIFFEVKNINLKYILHRIDENKELNTSRQKSTIEPSPQIPSGTSALKNESGFKFQMRYNTINNENSMLNKDSKSKSMDLGVINSIDYQNLLKPKKNIKPEHIFEIIDKNYLGLLKIFVGLFPLFIKIKNSDNRTPLYHAIHHNREDIVQFLLKHVNFNLVKNPHIYLHKAIRTRNAFVVSKLLEHDISPEGHDEQGSNAYHILFSCFNKSSSQCALIGEQLLRFPVISVNKLNNEHWAPIHIAARRASKDCLEWICAQNKLLEAEGKEIFNLNIKGKNKWTPLHLSVNGYRFEESMILLEYGADVLSKNEDNKTPKQVSNGNYLFTKLLKNYELVSIKSKLNSKAVSDEDKLPESHLVKKVKTLKVSDHYKSEMYDSPLNNQGTSTVELKKTEEDFEYDCLEISSRYKEEEASMKRKGMSFSNSKIDNEINESSNIANKLSRKEGESGIISLKNEIKSIHIRNNYMIPKMIFDKPGKIKTHHNPKSNSSFSFLGLAKINIYYHKELLLNNQNSPAIKYESLMQLNNYSVQNQGSLELQGIIKSILDELDLEDATQMNKLILCDILGIIIFNKYFDFIQQLEKLCYNIQKLNRINNLKEHNFLSFEILNTVNLLKLSFSGQSNNSTSSDNMYSANFENENKTINKIKEMRVNMNARVSEDTHRNRDNDDGAGSQYLMVGAINSSNRNKLINDIPSIKCPVSESKAFKDSSQFLKIYSKRNNSISEYNNIGDINALDERVATSNSPFFHPKNYTAYFNNDPIRSKKKLDLKEMEMSSRVATEEVKNENYDDQMNECIPVLLSKDKINSHNPYVPISYLNIHQDRINSEPPNTSARDKNKVYQSISSKATENNDDNDFDIFDYAVTDEMQVNKIQSIESPKEKFYGHNYNDYIQSLAYSYKYGRISNDVPLNALTDENISKNEDDTEYYNLQNDEEEN